MYEWGEKRLAWQQNFERTLWSSDSLLGRLSFCHKVMIWGLEKKEVIRRRDLSNIEGASRLQGRSLRCTMVNFHAKWNGYYPFSEEKARLPFQHCFVVLEGISLSKSKLWYMRTQDWSRKKDKALQMKLSNREKSIWDCNINFLLRL